MKYSFDSTVFNSIDNEEKAYWIGFLTGDGSVNKYSLRLELSNKDLSHLFKFKSFIKADYPIKLARKNCSNISINSKNFVESLYKYNIVPRKTWKNLGTPKNIEKDLLVHYYRGILDSDGWITQVYQGNKHRGGIGFSSYSTKILIEVKDFIKSYFPKIRSKVNTYQRGKWQVSQFQIGGMKMFLDIYRLFYENASVYLDRKMILGKEICYKISNNRKDERFKSNRLT